MDATQRTPIDWESMAQSMGVRMTWAISKVVAMGFISVMLYVCESYLSNISTEQHRQAEAQVTAEQRWALDHQSLLNVQRETDGTISVQQSLLKTVGTNSDSINYLNAQQAKDDAFREAHAGAVKGWQR